MNSQSEEKLIKLTFSASNAGKFRYKKRPGNIAFGKTFSTREDVFNETAYLEWQIGYDAIVKDVEAGNKQTKLTQISFVGDNKKEKYAVRIRMN